MVASTSGRPPEAQHKRYRKAALEDEPQLELVDSDAEDEYADAPQTPPPRCCDSHCSCSHSSWHSGVDDGSCLVVRYEEYVPLKKRRAREEQTRLAALGRVWHTVPMVPEHASLHLWQAVSLDVVSQAEPPQP